MADLAATSGMLLTLVGVRMGLWESLAAGPATPGELAARASASEPYIREWLRSQAAAGYVRYEPAAGRYRLPPAIAAVMADRRGSQSGRAAYMTRLTELDQDIDDASAGNDLERAARAVAERDALISELTQAVGLMIFNGGGYGHSPVPAAAPAPVTRPVTRPGLR